MKNKCITPPAPPHPRARAHTHTHNWHRHAHTYTFMQTQTHSHTHTHMQAHIWSRRQTQNHPHPTQPPSAVSCPMSADKKTRVLIRPCPTRLLHLHATAHSINIKWWRVHRTRLRLLLPPPPNPTSCVFKYLPAKIIFDKQIYNRGCHDRRGRRRDELMFRAWWWEVSAGFWAPLADWNFRSQQLLWRYWFAHCGCQAS